MRKPIKVGSNLKKAPKNDFSEQQMCILGGISYIKLLPNILPILQPTCGYSLYHTLFFLCFKIIVYQALRVGKGNLLSSARFAK